MLTLGCFLVLSLLRPAFHELAHIATGTYCQNHQELHQHPTPFEEISSPFAIECPLEKTAIALSNINFFHTPSVDLVPMPSELKASVSVRPISAHVLFGQHLIYFACGPPSA